MRRRRARSSWRGNALLVALVVLVVLGLWLLRDGADPRAEQPDPQRDGSGVAIPTEAADPAGEPPEGEQAVVVDVVDGDTLVLERGTRVRLVQIDAPERSGGECYGRAAADALRRLAPGGSRVRLTVDPALDSVDRYGRELRYVFRGSTNVNVALVRRGAASVWFFDGDRGRYADRLLAAAKEARAARRGLWRACPGTRLDPSRGVTSVAVAPTVAPVAPVGASRGCHPSYRGACVPLAPPDVDCPDVRAPVRVLGRDDHRLDSDGDGRGCETR